MRRFAILWALLCRWWDDGVMPPETYRALEQEDERARGHHGDAI